MFYIFTTAMISDSRCNS